MIKAEWTNKDSLDLQQTCNKLATTEEDLISRADAVNCVGWGDSVTEVINRIKSLPSAEAEPTVIRSRTLMPTKDFKEWAKRIRETNPNAVVIPCDAEVVSAEAVQVVRCKDCVYFHNGDCYNGNFPIKGDLANVYFDMKETDFCSYGERKGGDSE